MYNDSIKHNSCMVNHMSIEKLYNTAIYVRISREDGDKEESNSISVQKKMLSEYIKSNADLTLYDVFIDDGYSGTNFERPAFQRMLKDIERGMIQCVVVKDLSRLGRDYLGTGYYLEKLFPKYKVRFIAVNDHIDNIGDTDYDMLLPIRNIMNEQYARDISMKVQSAFKTKQRSGEFVGAFAAYGYRKSPTDKHKLIIDENAAQVVRRIYDLYVDGCPKLRIAKILNQDNILCPTEYKKQQGMQYQNSNKLDTTSYWTYATIHKILSNPLYKGDMVQGRTKRKMKMKPTTLDKSQWIIIPGTHEAIVPIEVWDKAQKLLSIKTREYNFNNDIGLFCGILYCGDCKRAMHKKKDKGKYVYYRCRTNISVGKEYCTTHNISEQTLEKIILSDINKMLKKIDDLKELVQQMDDERQKKSVYYQKEISRLKADIQKCQTLKKDSYLDYKEELITRSEYLSYKAEWEEKENALSTCLNDIINKQESFFKNDILDNPRIKRLIELKEIDTLTRPIVLEIIDRIDMYDDKRIKITYVFSKDIDLVDEIIASYETEDK